MSSYLPAQAKRRPALSCNQKAKSRPGYLQLVTATGYPPTMISIRTLHLLPTQAFLPCKRKARLGVKTRLTDGGAKYASPLPRPLKPGQGRPVVSSSPFPDRLITNHCSMLTGLPGTNPAIKAIILSTICLLTRPFDSLYIGLLNTKSPATSSWLLVFCRKKGEEPGPQNRPASSAAGLVSPCL